MKTFKKILLVFIGILLISSLTVSKKTKINGNGIKNDREFKAVWMSTFIGEAPYYNETQFKNDMSNSLDVLEHYGLNALIFHVRTHNNAFYKSDLNPVASWWSSVDFDEFDPLTWLIAETHKRGIEFHAWMNPYRIGTMYQSGVVPEANPQNHAENIIYANTNILNPALENVREHVFNTVDEFVTMYPTVDAIHFDDYFYVQTNAEPTSATRRRLEVDKLIEGVKGVLNDFNQTNNTAIQFGISPTGVWRNGSGEVDYNEFGHPITNGSNTRGYSHYGEPLYADTLKWAIEGWIDYLIPQTYWARDQRNVNFEPLLSWWNDVFKYLDVSVYSGLGVYKAEEASAYGWTNDLFELDEQFKILDNLDKVEGYSIFSFKHLRNGYNNSTRKSGIQINNGYEKASRRQIKILPEIRNMEAKSVLGVSNLKHENDLLTWDSVEDGKFYYIYNSSDEITYSADEIVGVMGHEEGKMSFDTSSYEGKNFSVRPISRTNHLGPTPIPIKEFNVTFVYGYDGIKDVITTEENTYINKPEDPKREGYEFLGWFFNYEEFNFDNPITSSVTLIARWEKTEPETEYVKVSFDKGNNNISTEEIIKGSLIKKPITPHKENKLFIGWYLNEELFDFDTLIIDDLTISAKWLDISELEDVSIYNKTEVVETDNTLNLRYSAIIKEKYIKNEHGFYLVYGRTNKTEFLSSINNNEMINNKKVFKVIVEGVTDKNTFNVTLTGIPEDNYNDLITVVPYMIDEENNLIISNEFQISSINYARNLNANNFKYDVIVNKKKKNFL